jgi:hypothetical protein
MRALVNRLDHVLSGYCFEYWIATNSSSSTSSSVVDWLGADRNYPGQPRLKGAKIINRTELAGHSTVDLRHYICSAPLDIERIAKGARGH